MKRFRQINFVALILCLLCFSAFAQTNSEIERELVGAITEVQKYSNYGENYDGEKLGAANEIFKNKILEYTKLPATLRYNFAELGKLMQIAQSEDDRLRVFSWDTGDGGTMHNYSKVFQYQGADGAVYSKTDEQAEGDPGSFVLDVFTLDAKGGKIYIVCTNFVGSTNDHYQTAKLFRIEGDKLSDRVDLIKTKSGLTNSLSFEYNFFSVADRPERPIRLIQFDKKTKTLKIPVVIENEKYPNGEVTNRYISYKFDGAYFVKIK